MSTRRKRNPGRAMPTQGIQAQRGQIVKKKEKRGKRLKAKKGDLVLLGNAPMRHMTGNVMRVLQVLDKERLLCEAVMPDDSDYEGYQGVVWSRKPKGKTKNGSQKHQWLPWAERLINVRERVVYKEIPVKPKRVVTSHEELQVVLAEGTDEEHVVLQLPTQLQP